MREITVGTNDAGQRLDKFLTKLMPKLPKSMMYKGLRKNCVRINGKHIKDGASFVNSGDVLTLYFQDEFFENETRLKYVKPRFRVIYEDANILVVDKPQGLLSHADETGGGETLVDMVKSYLYDKGEYDPESEQTFRPSLCNRLDRNTGGLVITAKTAEALREVNESIRSRRIRKFYTAIVDGKPPKNGHLEGHLDRHAKQTVVSDTGKRASLDYSVISYMDTSSVVEIELHTGRTHQIRAQFSDYGYPLVGDTKYGGTGKKYRQALYATRLILSFSEHSPLRYLNGKEIKIEPKFDFQGDQD